MNEPKTILIAEDHEVIRSGMRRILSYRPEWRVVVDARSGREAVDSIQAVRPDVALVSLILPDTCGVEVAMEVSRLKLNTLVLLLVTHDHPIIRNGLRAANIRGYVVKSKAATDLVRAIETLLKGETFFGERAA